MPPAEPSTGVFYLLVAMLIVGAVVLAKVFLWYRQWRSPVESSAMSMEEARDHFAAIMSERIGLSMRAGELDRVIIDHWEKWPLEYRPALYQILRQAQLMEECLYDEAVNKGIYPRRLLEGPLIPPLHPSPHALPENEDAVALTVDNVVSIPHPRREWINGQLLAKTG